MAGALDGVRVVELAIWAAAPAGGGIMADWGAEVIKVEDPDGGDPFRGFLSTGVGAATSSTINGSFDSDNRNKKSIAVDIRAREGREIVYRLVEQADVFLTTDDPLRRRARRFAARLRVQVANPVDWLTRIRS